ncbi:DNA-3-methyladenine glycosylase I [Morganella psychrotolerans]|uniref:DNA-3-methyladenine glycosylase I n=1 Tax=Morganella psychrotolerans TaxID=368603 RepID=A0A1B8H206_9GAMM|nr:DNA-3-methyladenine glycosylase I [Morganella psychrotolerans]OBU03108.1 DNA-3-methyladenine glycosidase [Morganella psychrotolerans]
MTLSAASQVRCAWVTDDPLYIHYHDNEWGVPERDNHKLFEMICLEGQQAGLSWLIILKKRENYRQAFFNFDPVKVAAMTEDDVDRLMQNPGIVRQRTKIKAIISNAAAYLAMEEKGEDFSRFLWNFVGNTPLVNQHTDSSSIPTDTPLSHSLAKELKKRGFKFCGPVICYSFMQAIGMINDHLPHCSNRH